MTPCRSAALPLTLIKDSSSSRTMNSRYRCVDGSPPLGHSNAVNGGTRVCVAIRIKSTLRKCRREATVLQKLVVRAVGPPDRTDPVLGVGTRSAEYARYAARGDTPVLAPSLTTPADADV